MSNFISFCFQPDRPAHRILSSVSLKQCFPVERMGILSPRNCLAMPPPSFLCQPLAYGVLGLGVRSEPQFLFKSQLYQPQIWISNPLFRAGDQTLFPDSQDTTHPIVPQQNLYYTFFFFLTKM